MNTKNLIAHNFKKIGLRKYTQPHFHFVLFYHNTFCLTIFRSYNVNSFLRR